MSDFIQFLNQHPIYSALLCFVASIFVVIFIQLFDYFINVYLYEHIFGDDK